MEDDEKRRYDDKDDAKKNLSKIYYIGKENKKKLHQILPSGPISINV